MSPFTILHESASYKPTTKDITLCPSQGNGSAVLPVNLQDLGNVFRIEFDFKLSLDAGSQRKGEGLLVGISSTFAGLSANDVNTIVSDTNGIYIGFNEFPNFKGIDNRISFYMKSQWASSTTGIGYNITDGTWRRAVCYFDFNQMKFRVVIPNNDIWYTHNTKLTLDGKMIYIRGTTGWAYGTKEIRNIQVYNSWI